MAWSSGGVIEGEGGTFYSTTPLLDHSITSPQRFLLVLRYQEDRAELCDVQEALDARLQVRKADPAAGLAELLHRLDEDRDRAAVHVRDFGEVQDQPPRRVLAEQGEYFPA